MPSKPYSPPLPLPLLAGLGLHPKRARGIAAATRRSEGVAIQINAGCYELLPATWVQPKTTAALRQRSTAVWALRDRRDGRVIQWLYALDARPCRSLGRPPAALGERAARGLQRALGLRAALKGKPPMPAHQEPPAMACGGRDRYGRALWLSADAARAWRAMQRSAARGGVSLEALSGFRSFEHQAAIIRRKLKRGLSVDQILAVNAAPGESEHHTGRALDIGCPGEPPAEETFEGTRAFGWLQANAVRFGFRLSYPRDNPFGIVYEPWHWCWHPPVRAGLRQPPRRTGSAIAP